MVAIDRDRVTARGMQRSGSQTSVDIDGCTVTQPQTFGANLFGRAPAATSRWHRRGRRVKSKNMETRQRKRSYAAAGLLLVLGCGVAGSKQPTETKSEQAWDDDEYGDPGDPGDPGGCECGPCEQCISQNPPVCIDACTALQMCTPTGCVSNGTTPSHWDCVNSCADGCCIDTTPPTGTCGPNHDACFASCVTGCPP